jgi:hypothetical protein
MTTLYLFAPTRPTSDVIMMTLALWAQQEQDAVVADQVRAEALSQFNASQQRTMAAAAGANAAAMGASHKMCSANHGTRRVV